MASKFLTHQTRGGKQQQVRVISSTAQVRLPAEPATPLAVHDVNALQGEPLHDHPLPLDVEVAVICASYNGGKWAEDWVQSVEQAFEGGRRRVGVIIVDDGSTAPLDLDKWGVALTTFRRSLDFRLIQLRRNVGSTAARNVAVRSLTDGCKWLIFLDADDRLCGQDVQKLIIEMGRRRAHIGWGRINYDRGGVIGPEHMAFREEALQGQKQAAELLNACRCNPIPLLGTVVSRKAFDAVGGFDPAMRHCGDWDLWLRMFDNGAKLLPMQVGPMATYRVHDGQLHKCRTFKAYQKHVAEARQKRLEAASLRRGQGSPTLAMYQWQWSTGGAQAVLVNLAEILAGRGWGVSSVARKPAVDDGLERQFGAVGPCYTVDSGEALKLLNAAGSRFTYRGDLLLPGVKSTCVHYGGDSDWNKTPPPDYVKGLYCSQWLRDYLERARGVCDPRGQVIPNAIPVADIGSAVGRQAVRSALGIEPDAFVYLWAGRLVGVKNPAMFARAAALAAQGLYGRPFYFVVAGPPYSRVFTNDFFAAVAEYKLENHMRYLGGVLPEVMPLVCHAADAYVSTSHFEGLGLSILEAMAAGLPVVATDVGGVREAVEDGDSGVLVRPGDHSATAEQMMALYFSQERAAQIGAAARRRAGMFDLHPWATRHEIAFLQGE